jgi:hypothetical protein
MSKLPGNMRALCIAVVVLALVAAGCGSKSSSQQAGAGSVVNVTPSALLADITAGIPSVTPALGGWDWVSFISNFGTLLTSFRYTLDMQKVTYQSTGADGNGHSMTGLLILPRSISGGRPSVPILMYQHGTEVYRQFSPSQYLTHLGRPTDYPEVMVAAAIASTGYAVAMADYEGMGDNTDPQPHVVGTVLAQQVIDLLIKSHDIIVGTSSPCTWNNQLFLMGYSEGGYVTMMVTRALHFNPVPGFTVTASAPLSGPHDLSGTMRGVILGTILTEQDGTYKAPYFVPMLLTSYNYAYGTLFNPGTAMLPQFQNIPPLFDGNSQSVTINNAMKMDFTPPVSAIVPKSILANLFIAQLTPPSVVVDFLIQNDSYRFPGQVNSVWAPTVPIRMIHHKDDDLVPYANSQIAFNAFSTASAKNHILRGPGVELVEENIAISISSDPAQTVHFAAAFPELIAGWTWLNSFK